MPAGDGGGPQGRVALEENRLAQVARGSLFLMGFSALLLAWLVQRRCQPGAKGASRQDRKPRATIRSSP
jgi:hypothetical protein